MQPPKNFAKVKRSKFSPLKIHRRTEQLVVLWPMMMCLSSREVVRTNPIFN